MNSRERFLTAINHEAPDRVPCDLGGWVTTISVIAYNGLLKELGIDREREVFDWLEVDDTLETGCFRRLAAAGQLMAYRHEGFWTCMDTYKDSLALNDMWESGNAPWKVWDD